VGYCFPNLKRFDLVEETFVAGVRPSMTPIRFSTVHSLQLPSSCLHRLGLLTEYFVVC
jgi:hypothetical protein